MMKLLLAVVCVLFGCAVGTGCNAEVAPPAQSEFQGEDMEKQMKAMEDAGKETAGESTPAAR